MGYYLVLKRHMGLDPGDVIEASDDDVIRLHVGGGLLEPIPVAQGEHAFERADETEQL